MAMKKIHLIGNAHLDPVWLWQWQEGFAEIRATFRSALDRMKEFDDFKFTSACASYYMWIEEIDKKMFEEIKQRVKEGRWCIVGGWFLQPDCNMPSGESFARHSLISQRYFKEKFGITAKTGYNVDSFGHNGNLPQILKNSGMDSYVFMRPGVGEKELPSSLFDWESADGSRVRTYRIPERYNIDCESFDVFEKIKKMAAETDMMAFYGVGNHGGGATVELLEKMHGELTDEYIYSTPNEYFESVKDCSVPTVTDDLQFHAKGCYSVCSRIKSDNAKAENMLFEAETYSVLANRLTKAEYPYEKLDTAWKNVLFNQFHDILGGCSIREAYTSARNLHGEAMSIAEKASNYAIQKICQNIDTSQGKELKPYKRNVPLGAAYKVSEALGTPVVVFNPHAYAVKTIVSVRDMPKYITDDSGNAVPIQRIRDSKTNWDDKYKTAFSAELPPLGYRVYRMYFGGEERKFEPLVSVSRNALENKYVRIEFDEQTGEISAFYSKKTGENIIIPGAFAELMDETEYDTWAHGAEKFKKSVYKSVSGSVKIIESGVLRAGIRTEQSFENTKIVRDYYLGAYDSEVTVRTKIDFYDKHRMLKFSIPAAEKNPKARCGIPFGHINRPTDGTEQVFNNWISLGKLAIACPDKHSFDADGNVLSLTVLRGAVYADHYGIRDEMCEYIDQGEHFFEYSVFPFTTASDAERKAESLGIKPFAITESYHKGSLGTEFSAVSQLPENIIVTAVKAAEDGNGTVIRMYEADGKDTDAEAEFFGIKLKAHFSHNQIKTFIIKNETVSKTDFNEF